MENLSQVPGGCKCEYYDPVSKATVVQIKYMMKEWTTLNGSQVRYVMRSV
jgi:hypothetical protein